MSGNISFENFSPGREIAATYEMFVIRIPFVCSDSHAPQF